MKKVIIALLLISCCFCLAHPATAASNTVEIEPRWDNISKVYAGLEISKILGIAECTGQITTRVNQPVELVVNLQQKKDGYWTTIKTWTKTGTQSTTFVGSYAVYRGYEYKVTVAGYLYNSNGDIQEAGTAYYTVDFS